MLSSVFTLTVRALIQDSRLIRSHLLRLLFVGIILWMLYLTVQSQTSFGAAGLNFFMSVTYLNFVLITLGAPGFFATVITEEKEERTLDLLKLTGMSPLSLLLGKSAARLLSAMFLLSVQFPFTWLGITLGGVTPDQVLAAYVALLAYLLFVSNLALFCSVVCRSSSRAATMTGSILGIVLVGPWLTGWILSLLTLLFPAFFHPSGTIVEWIHSWIQGAQSIAVIRRLSIIMSTRFAETAFSSQVLIDLAAGGIFFFLSWRFFEYFAAEREAPAPERGILLWRRQRWGRIGVGRAWNSALMWKDFHFIAGGWLTLALKTLLYGAVISLPLFFEHMTFEGWIGSAFFFMLLFSAAEILYYASHLFYDEVRGNTLSSLMMMPQSLREVAYAKAAGCWLGLLPAVAYLFVIFVISLLSSHIWQTFDGPGVDDAIVIMTMIFLEFWMFVHLLILLSVTVRWGALGLTLLALMVLNGFFGPILRDGFPPVMCFVSFFGIPILHVLIAERLQVLAGR